MTKKVEDLTNEQIDVLVAEHVKGWLRIPGVCVGDYWFDEATKECYDVFTPTTDIACAFLVDKPEWEWFFGEKGDDLHANVYVASEESGVYTVVVPLDPANKTAAYCRGRCIAALKACGVTEVE